MVETTPSPLRDRVDRRLFGGGSLAFQGLLVLQAVVSALAAKAVLDLADGIRTAWFPDMLDPLHGLVGLMVAIWVILLAVQTAWTWRAYWASAALEPGARSWSEGWVVAAPFVPLANLFVPWAVLNEIERIAVAPRHLGKVRPDWRQRRVSMLGIAWWVSQVAGLGATLWLGFLAEFGLTLTEAGPVRPSIALNGVEPQPLNSAAADSYANHFRVCAFAFGLYGVSCLLLIVLVRRIDRRLGPGAPAELPAARRWLHRDRDRAVPPAVPPGGS